MTDDILDIAAVGVGPFNLALAALADDLPELSVAAYEQRQAFDWHPGLLFDWATLQVSFLADLVSLVRPTSQWSFLSYLIERDRMYPFYIAERFHIPRREYADYCGWVAASLPSCRFGTRVEALDWDAGRRLWVLTLVDVAGGGTRVQAARNVVLGVGSDPVLPEPLEHLAQERVFHSARYLYRVGELAAGGADHVVVVGSGQSGAEVFLDLMRRQRDTGSKVTWLTRTPMFAPLDYTKLDLECTTPEYMHYFHGLEPEVRDRLIESQWQLYKGIDAGTIDQVHAELYEHMLDGDRPQVSLLPGVQVDGAVLTGPDRRNVRLDCRHRDTGRRVTVDAGVVIAATGYATRPPACLEPVRRLLRWDEQGRYDVRADHRVRTAPEVTGGLYVQNAELHTHGAGSPDLGIGAYRSAVILNGVAGREAFRLPKRTAFQSFGVS